MQLWEPEVVRSVQWWRDLSVCVEGLGTDGFWHSVLWCLVVFISSSTWSTCRTGLTTVSIPAFYVNKSHVERTLFVSRSDLCEGSTPCRGVDVFVWLLRVECCCEGHYGVCGCDWGAGTGSIESKHLIWTVPVDDKIFRRHKPFAWWPVWERERERERERESEWVSEWVSVCVCMLLWPILLYLSNHGLWAAVAKPHVGREEELSKDK